MVLSVIHFISKKGCADRQPFSHICGKIVIPFLVSFLDFMNIMNFMNWTDSFFPPTRRDSGYRFSCLLSSVITFLLQKKQWVFHWDLSIDFFEETVEGLNQMNVLLVLDLRMHDNILDGPAFYPLVPVRFASQDDPGTKYLPWSCKIQWDLVYLSLLRLLSQYWWKITETNNTVVFVEIWRLHTNLIFVSFQFKWKINCWNFLLTH